MSIQSSKIELAENFEKYQKQRAEADGLGEIAEIDGRATVQLLFTITMLLLDSGIEPKETFL